MPVYLDHHATTPCDPQVVEAMLPWFTERFGNPTSRAHAWGLEAGRAVEEARAQVAALVGASPKEIVWTSGATESDNLAILGAARAAGRGHVVTVATEHEAVLEPCRALADEGFDVTVLPVDGHGEIDPARVEAALRPDTVLVSAMAVNNEIGVLHPIAELGRICRERGVLLHCDAAQAPGHVPLDVAALQVDLMSLSAHKMYGPKGIGALYVRRGRPRVALAPLVHGGGQERGLRSGTLPVPLCVGMGVAAELAREAVASGVPERLRGLRDRLWRGLVERVDGVRLNGPPLDRRAPHNLNLGIDGVESEALIVGLRDVVAFSSGSACTSATLQASHVLRAMDLDDARAHGSVRFGIGRSTTADQIDLVIEHVAAKVAQLRDLGSLYEPEASA